MLARGFNGRCSASEELGAAAPTTTCAAVAAGAEDYYLAEGEAPGRWLGAGADGLDLEGEVAGDDLRAVLDGRDPADGAQLVRGPGGSARAHARL